MKVLHVVENLNRGAVENWLVRMLEHARMREMEPQWNFYCALGEAGRLDEAAQSAGAEVIYSPCSLDEKIDFVRALRRTISNGSYDILHCHHDLISAVYLAASAGLPVRRRIVHIHNADEAVPTPNRFKQHLYRESLRRVCLSMADKVVGISNHTLDTFLAGRPRKIGRDVVHYYGLDTLPFEAPGLDRRQFRRELSLPEDAPILLFAGRIVPEKNPLFAK